MRINRLIAAVLVPLLLGTQSPAFWLRQQQYKPKELISLSQSSLDGISFL